jgi:hypothetical protein
MALQDLTKLVFRGLKIYHLATLAVKLAFKFFLSFFFFRFASSIPGKSSALTAFG